MKEQEDFDAKGDGQIRMVMMPTYETDKKLKIDREKDIPPPKMYMGLGWDENKDT